MASWCTHIRQLLEAVRTGRVTQAAWRGSSPEISPLVRPEDSAWKLPGCGQSRMDLELSQTRSMEGQLLRAAWSHPGNGGECPQGTQGDSQGENKLPQQFFLGQKFAPDSTVPTLNSNKTQVSGCGNCGHCGARMPSHPGLPGTLPVLTLKVPHPWRPVSSRQSQDDWSPPWWAHQQ